MTQNKIMKRKMVSVFIIPVLNIQIPKNENQTQTVHFYKNYLFLKIVKKPSEALFL